MSMKKYTVYEIEKLTDGKLSKYKLTKAIKNEELEAEFAATGKRGRGTPNYYVYEDELEKYLEKLEKERKKKIKVPGQEDALKTIKPGDMDVKQLQDRLKMLEVQQSRIIPYIEELEKAKVNEGIKSNERRELLLELSNIPPFATKKKQELIRKLNQIA